MLFNPLRAAAFALLAAASLSVSNLAATAETFKLGVNQDALSLDPIATSDNASIWAQLLLYDQLVRPTEDGTDLMPGLAESWEQSTDGTTYTFHLREAKFSNGDPVTAEDVVFSLERAASEASNWSRFFQPITAAEAVDDRTVTIKLDEPFTPLINNLAMFSAAILPADLVKSQGDAFFENPVGSGPFVLKEWQRGGKIVLAANPHYWQEGKPYVDGVELVVVGEDNSRVLQLRSGNLDAIIGVPFNQVKSLDADPNIAAGVANVFRVEFVQLNSKKEPFGDERVRQALNYAVDKEGIVQGILFGNGQVAVSSLPAMAYHNEALEPYPHDPAKAQALLTEAGLGDGFSTTMLVPSGDVTYQQVASAIQANLAEVGVQVQLQLIESGAQWDTTKSGNYEMSLSYATSDTIDPDQLIGFTAVNPERANAYHTEWRSERLNELYEQERRTPDGPERGAMFKEMEQIVHDEAPYIFLYNMGAPYAYRSNVEGFAILPTSNWRLENVKLQ